MTMTNDRSLPRGLILFTISYMAVCSIAAFNQGNTEFLMYAAMMIVFIITVLAIHMRVHFSRTALWLLAVWGCLHMMGGTIPISERFVLGDGSPVLYSLRLHPDLPRYDQITHAFGFFSATVACWEAARVLLSARRSLALSVIAVLMGMGLGAINEVIEFAATRVTETNVGGYVNTGWDLVSNSIGAVSAGIWCLTRRV